MSKNKESQSPKPKAEVIIGEIEAIENEIARLIEERKSNQKNSNQLIRENKEKLALLIANKSK